MEYQRIGAWRHRPAVSTDPLLEGVLERLPDWYCRVVFGTLLGPETTGPVPWSPSLCCGGVVGVSGTCVSGFPAAASMHCLGPFWGSGVWGVWSGVVV